MCVPNCGNSVCELNCLNCVCVWNGGNGVFVCTELLELSGALNCGIGCVIICWTGVCTQFREWCVCVLICIVGMMCVY